MFRNFCQHLSNREGNFEEIVGTWRKFLENIGNIYELHKISANLRPKELYHEFKGEIVNLEKSKRNLRENLNEFGFVREIFRTVFEKFCVNHRLRLMQILNKINRNFKYKF